MKYNFLFLIIIFFLIGCEKSNFPTAATEKPSAGALCFSFDKVNAPAAVNTLTTTLSRSGYSTIEKSINILNDSPASILFEQIAIGKWNVKVDAKDEYGQILFTGQSEVIVIENNLSQVNLVLTPVAIGVGSVQINVTWGQSASGWIDYEYNAVLEKSSNFFESKGVTQPHVYKINGVYHLYYAGLNSLGFGSISLATSLDGITWTKYGSNPVFTASGNGWDAHSISTGPIIMVDSAYIMYYQGYSLGTGQMNTGIAISKDGIVWERPWNNRITVEGSDVYHVSDVIKKNGAYYLYYDGFDNSTGYRAVFLATSSNGIEWKKIQSQPILKSTHAWEIGGITFSTIVYEDGKYTTVYADNGYFTCNFGIATSIDGITWMKEDAPIFNVKMTIGQWAHAGITYPFFTKVGDQKRIYYVGAVGSVYEQRIGFAYFK